MGGGARWEAVVDLCRKDASALTRLKHPAIVKVCSISNTRGNASGIDVDDNLMDA